MSRPDNDFRQQLFQIQINLQIPDGCSQTTVYKSLREKIDICFDRVPLFQTKTPVQEPVNPIQSSQSKMLC